ncbi:MAG: hypothetical protein AAF431_17165 [Pseudomonadota bacterium]
MKFDLRKLKLTQRRLLIAATAAFTAHLLLMIFGHWGIEFISIPSKEERPLVLTLETTPQDGVKRSQNPADETLNEVRKGEAASIANDQRQNQITSAPEPGLELVSETQATEQTVPEETITDPVPENIEATESEPEPGPVETEATEYPPIETIAAQSEPEASVETEFEVTAESLVTNTSQESAVPKAPTQDILTASQGAVQLPSFQESPQIESVAKISVTAEQKKMLNRKITKAIEKMIKRELVTESLSWQSRGQVYEAKLSHEPASGEMDLDEIRVEVITEENGNRLSTEMRMKKLAFSNFAQFVHRWSPNVQIHDDVMDGRFHSNTEINLDYDRKAMSVFHGKVTTSSRSINVERSSAGYKRKNVFRGGLETGVRRINMPKPQHLFEAPAEQNASSEVVFEQDTRILFRADGYYLHQAMDAVGPPRLRSIGDQPLYLIAAEGVSLHISGTLKGKVLVYSPHRIVIEGNLRYQNQENLDSSYADEDGDILGLVSGRDIVIAEPEVTGPGDLTINASIYARRRFLVKDYQDKNKGTLHLNGSLSVGTLSATEPRYATRIVFDRRLENLRPPGYPVTDRYELAMYDRDWTTEPAPQNQ